jgi:hypothetical protein
VKAKPPANGQPAKATKAAPKPAPAPKPAAEAAGGSVDGRHDSRLGSFRESVIEHAFQAELLKEAWRRETVVDVLRPDVDAGADFVLVANGVVRYVQLRTSRAGAKTSRQRIALGLRDTPHACVVWIVAGDDFALSYRYLDPAALDWDALPVAKGRDEDDSARHERLSHRIVTRGQFKQIADIGKLFEALFG